MVGFSMLNMMNTVVRCMLYAFVLFFKMAQGVEENIVQLLLLYTALERSLVRFLKNFKVLVYCVYSFTKHRHDTEKLVA